MPIPTEPIARPITSKRRVAVAALGAEEGDDPPLAAEPEAEAEAEPLLAEAPLVALALALALPEADELDPPPPEVDPPLSEKLILDHEAPDLT